MFSISYRLSLLFAEDVDRHFYTLRMLPRPEMDVERESLTVNGKVLSETGRDSFSNRIISSYAEGKERCFEAVLECTVHEAPLVKNEVRDGVALGYFRYPTHLTSAGEDLSALADGLIGDDPFEIAESAMMAAHNALTYAKGYTDNSTSADDAYRARYGVCQDYSHIMLALLRRRGVICRYAAGITKGEGESHAWVEVLSSGLWKGFDPTRAKGVDESCIPFSYGRDASDSPMNFGVYRGRSSSSIHVIAECREC